MPTLQFHKENSVATLTFDRPEAMNTLNQTMANELAEIFTELKNDAQIRVLILNGSGKLFMAGGDVSYFHENLNSLSQTVRKVISQVHFVVNEMQQSDKIILSSVHGSVAGVGLSFMLASDLVIAAQETKFTLAYSKLGTSPDGGVTYTLPRLVGTKKAMELALLSDIFDTSQAKEFGLINWIVPPENLLEATKQLANRIASGPAQAFSSIKKLINHSWQNNFIEQLQAEEEAFVAATKTEDFKRGVNAFVSKTKVNFL